MRDQVIGGEKNFWLYSEAYGYDLTHPLKPTSPYVYPRIQLETTKGPIAIDPHKSALVIVDMQNYFLSPSLGNPSDGAALKAMDQLLKHAIPACRMTGMPIVWLNWGLTQEDIDEMPPTMLKRHDKMGSDIGPVKLENGSVVDGGRVLVRDHWNSESYPPLKEACEPQDICVNKNRTSGFWGGKKDIEEVLTISGIRTLLFAGANIDQGVGASLHDALTKGWDCLLLSDGCATASPDFATQFIEYNCEVGWGFVLTCKELAKGVDNMEE